MKLPRESAVRVPMAMQAGQLFTLIQYQLEQYHFASQIGV